MASVTISEQTELTELLTNMAALEVSQWQIGRLKPYPHNPRKIGPEAINKVAGSIRAARRFTQPILVDEDDVILAGHTRRLAALQLGLRVVPVIVISGLTEAQKLAYRIADNRVGEESSWDDGLLKATFERIAAIAPPNFEAFTGFDPDEMARIVNFDPAKALADLQAAEAAEAEEKQKTEPRRGHLAEKFGIPPLSVLSTRESWWVERDRAWRAAGIEGTKGREAKAIVGGVEPEAEARFESASSFSPTLAELVYRWFCPPGGVILDPFAGGSTRGLVASRLGREYHGIDVRLEQITANTQQLAHAGTPAPTWYRGDSVQLDGVLPVPILADLIFSCPPYWRLERYSDLPEDLSAMSWPDFLTAYGAILEKAAARLKPGRFAVLVIGDVRGDEGNYMGLPEQTYDLAERAGLNKYGEAILVNQVGTAAMKAEAQFTASRKLARVHQNVLIFVKGDPRSAASAIGDCEFGPIAPPA